MFTEDVVVSDAAPLLRLNPLRPQAVGGAPCLQLRAEPDDMQERPLHGYTAGRERAVIAIEVAVYGDAPGLGELDSGRQFPALEVVDFQLVRVPHLRSEQIGRKAHKKQGLS